MSPARTLAALAAVTLLLAVGAARSQAVAPCTKETDYGSTTDKASWHDGANWDPDGVPQESDVACVTDFGGTHGLIAHVGATTTVEAVRLLGTSELLVRTSGGITVRGAATESSIGGLGLQNADFTNLGRAVWTDKAISVDDGTLTNDGTLEVSSDDVLFGNGRLVNTGTLRKTATEGTFSHLRVPFDNSGAVAVEAGTLQLDRGGQHTGAFAVAPGTTLELRNGHTLSASSTVTGSGKTFFSLGTNTVGGAYDVATTEASGGTVTFNGATELPTLIVSGGVATVNDPVAPNALTVSAGGLGGTAPVTIAGGGSLDWSGGQLVGTGVLTVPAGARFSVTGASSKLLSERTLVQEANAVWDGGDLTLTQGAVLQNRGSFEVRGDQDLFHAAGAVSRIENTGTFAKTAGGDVTEVGPEVRNDGTLRVDAGTLRLRRTLLNYAANRLAGGTYVARGTLELTGAFFGSADIQTNEATIVLDGPGSSLRDFSTGQSALRNLATNGAAGSITVRNGKALATSRPVANAGTLVLGDASTFTATGDYTQTGGLTRLAQPTSRLVASSGSVRVRGGRLEGIGHIEPGLALESGTVGPGLSTGELTVEGSFAQTGGQLEIEVDGTTADRLAVTGAASLGGTLVVSAANTSGLRVGDRIPILTAASRTGTFASARGLDAGGGVVFELDYGPTGVALVVASSGQPPALPTLSVADVGVAEGDAVPADAIFTVTLSAPSAAAVEVDAATADGTATAGSDYTAVARRLAFAPGETSLTLTVPVLGDAIDESDETFVVRLTNAAGATISGGQATGTIVDDDAAPPDGACILVEPATPIDFGAHSFSRPGAPVQAAGSAPVTIRNCGAQPAEIQVQGTNAAGGTATWFLVDQPDPCAAGPGRYALSLGSLAVTGGIQPLGLLAAGADRTEPAVLTMPCTGSGGAGETLGLQLLFTASGA